MALSLCAGNFTSLGYPSYAPLECLNLFQQSQMPSTGCEKMNRVWDQIKETLSSYGEICANDNICSGHSSVLDLTLIQELIQENAHRPCSIRLSSAEAQKTIAWYLVERSQHTFVLKDFESVSDEDSIVAETDFRKYLKVRWSATWSTGVLSFQRDNSNSRKISFTYENALGTISGKCQSKDHETICQYNPIRAKSLWKRVKNVAFGAQEIKMIMRHTRTKGEDHVYKLDIKHSSRYFAFSREHVGSFVVILNSKGSFHVSGSFKSMASLFFAYHPVRRSDEFFCKVSKDSTKCRITHEYVAEGTFSSERNTGDVHVSLDPTEIDFSLNRKRWVVEGPSAPSQKGDPLLSSLTRLFCKTEYTSVRELLDCEIEGVAKNNIEEVKKNHSV